MLRKNEKGQSLVEMALLLPILIILLIGVIDFGRFLYTNMHLHLATQETVRLASLGANDQELQSFINSYTHVNNQEDLQMHISLNENQRVSGEYVTITLEYPMEIMTPFVSKIITFPLKIETKSTIRIE
ncbi:TadE/TadG family type IV pilus assembly protein [Desulfuribacillus alkaliarsenatis]|uniref:Pilus assembly protein TadE n=1 Tax=Desulfuribacillus alkaliarsenatis TaxID=766136 RepID=A0A1E5G0G7_9FIRM|nr:TadE/TadG family type IV pilus assembly protein [Desulfuribacillus alkaliarsenatis]OEF96199.1 pilus assembly protein TadE [Desulfuribacillus alkaliarsenatis]